MLAGKQQTIIWILIKLIEWSVLSPFESFLNSCNVEESKKGQGPTVAPPTYFSQWKQTVQFLPSDPSELSFLGSLADDASPIQKVSANKGKSFPIPAVSLNLCI